MSNTRQRLVFGMSVVLVGSLMFLVTSSYVVDHRYSKWLALAVGLFTFPIAPLLWHWLGERKRAKRRATEKTPSKSTMTGGDRLWLRIAAIALLTIGPMIVASRLGVIGATWRHGLWFLPTPEKSLIAERDKLLRMVPADAELVVWFHKAADGKDPGGSALLAWGNGEVLLVADAPLTDGKDDRAKQIAELNANRDKVKWLPIAPLAEVKTSDGSIMLASEAWRAKLYLPTGGASQALRDELARAPKSAPFIAAFVPRTVQPTTKAGVVWATANDDGLVIDARIEQTDAASAALLVTLANLALHGKTSDIPEKCREAVGKIVDRVKLTQTEAVVTGHAAIGSDQLMGLFVCAM